MLNVSVIYTCKILSLSRTIRFSTMLAFMLITISWVSSTARSYSSLSTKTSLLRITNTTGNLRWIHTRTTNEWLLMLYSTLKSVSFTVKLSVCKLIYRVQSLCWTIKFAFSYISVVNFRPIRLVLWTMLVNRRVITSGIVIRSRLLLWRLLSLLRFVHIFVWENWLR